MRFETPPGHQGQVDFAEVRLPWGKRHVLMVVLGYSRLLWLQCYPRQTMRTLIGGLETAFAYFGGVPRELLFDQLKAVIVDDQRPQGGRVLENPEFLRFAAHWGFRIRACRPYRAQTKGKVERPIRYVRQSFLYGRTFAGDADLNAQALPGSIRSPIPGCMAPRATSRASASSRTSVPCSCPWPRDPTARWCCSRSPSRSRARRVRCPASTWSGGPSPPTRP